MWKASAAEETSAIARPILPGQASWAPGATKASVAMPCRKT
jgi:hypothetical protein